MGDERWTREALAERCEVIEDGIVGFREVPGGKAKPFAELIDICNELGRPFGEWVIILDLADATRPTPGLVESMPRLFRTGAKHWVVHLHVKNKIMVGVGDFLMRRFSHLPVAVRNTREEAIEAARLALRGELED